MNDPNSYDSTVNQPGKLIPQDDDISAEHPQRIGRYRIVKVLGKGGFGFVYLADDEKLNRQVAVKVPHAKLISTAEDAEAYLAEARIVANLDHPGIVPVYDVGSTEDCRCYVVSKYIEGTDLAKRLQQQRLTYRDAVEFIRTVAEALHYAHKQDVVHRDIKPGNLLLDKNSTPFVADFGSALREENRGKGPKYVGTPAYMSPEQARGEGHRVDGRSDIFSLGVVFYELLVCRKPFRGNNLAELLEQITSCDPKPLLQYDEKLPEELQRICFKALAKRSSDRYSSAYEMAEDLRHFLAEQTVIQEGTTRGGVAAQAKATAPDSTLVSPLTPTSTSTGTDSSDSQPIRIIPKGLRAYDSHDADFFLELLPGPRDREGVPDSLRFWKLRIEETDPSKTFAVGLIYGPSGCGKSSLVKAGLLPRLSEDVIPVYIEATPEETEARLLHGLRKHCPLLEDNLTLKDTLAALRRGQGIPVGKKVLIVLDQFEQWLHAKRDEQNTELVQAVRQCDGGRVQCIVTVRSDFWLAVSRFLRELEVNLVEGQNSALADLFDLEHARKVLTAFGRAFGKLPEKISEITNEQKDFVHQSVADLAEDGKVICVRLALFAEMMKGRAWTPATLQEVGGTRGLGETFLEETFSASTAPPEHRYYQRAARAVLKSLLPDSGTDIKGQMKSQNELLAVSEYANSPKDFDDLIRILDTEIRLITPIDPEGVQFEFSERSGVSPPVFQSRYYQLTHDYLVPSLREWLTRKKKESSKGRAELKLEERSGIWNRKPEQKQLPTFPEWLSICLQTQSKRWSKPQKAMMDKATRLYGLRFVIGIALAFALVVRYWLNWQAEEDRQLKVAVASLMASPTLQVKTHFKQLEQFSDEAPKKLHTEYQNGRLSQLKAVHALIHFNNVGSDELQFLLDGIAAVPSGDTGYLLTVLSDLKAKDEEQKAKDGEPKANDEEHPSRLERHLRDRIAQNSDDTEKQGRYLAVCVALGYPVLATQNWDSEHHRNDPSLRSSFIDMFHPLNGDISHIPNLLENDQLDRDLRYALCAAVGRLGKFGTEANTEVLRKLYIEATDAGTHSAARWALIQRGLAEAELEKMVVTQPESSQRDWYVCTSQGITMVKIPSGSFALRVVTDRENGIEQKPTTFDSFWMSDREISFGHFEAIMTELRPKTASAETVVPNRLLRPAANLTWFDAIEFCNRLSKEENLQPYYELGEVNAEKSDGHITAAKVSIMDEKRLGYRLPTEIEWEYACRAMSPQNYCYGDSVELLPAYAEFSTGSAVECGRRIPNAWGLFDMHGNVWEWCWDRYDLIGNSRVLRGGSFHDFGPQLLRSANRYHYLPENRFDHFGFRITRNL